MFSSFSLVPSLFLLSFLLYLFSSLSVTMTMITRPVGSLCVHKALTCQSVRVHGPWPIPCWPNMFASCKKQLSRYSCARLLPFGKKWACVCAGNGCWVWCLVVLVCVSMRYYVLSSLCCWSRQCWRRCVGCCVVVTVQKKKETTSVIIEKIPRENFPLQFKINSKKIKNLHHSFLKSFPPQMVSRSSHPKSSQLPHVFNLLAGVYLHHSPSRFHAEPACAEHQVSTKSLLPRPTAVQVKLLSGTGFQSSRRGICSYLKDQHTPKSSGIYGKRTRCDIPQQTKWFCDILAMSKTH